MTDDDLELAILKKNVAQHEEANRLDPSTGSSVCANSTCEVIGGLTGKTAQTWNAWRRYGSYDSHRKMGGSMQGPPPGVGVWFVTL